MNRDRGPIVQHIVRLDKRSELFIKPVRGIKSRIVEQHLICTSWCDGTCERERLRSIMEKIWIFLIASTVLQCFSNFVSRTQIFRRVCRELGKDVIHVSCCLRSRGKGILLRTEHVVLAGIRTSRQGRWKLTVAWAEQARVERRSRTAYGRARGKARGVEPAGVRAMTLVIGSRRKGRGTRMVAIVVRGIVGRIAGLWMSGADGRWETVSMCMATTG